MREYVYHYRRTTIKSIIKKINYKELLIPSLLSPFTWSAAQIVSLFDSIYQGYPIGTFYLWELKEGIENTQFYSFPKNNQRKGSEFTELYERPNAIIDGLQRLTALYLGFHGTYTDETDTKTLYFIPQTSIEPKNRSSFFEFLNDGEYQQLEQKGETIIKVQEFIKNKPTNEITNTAKNMPQPYDQQQQIKNKINRFFDRVNERKIIIYLSEINTNPDNIIKTHRQINGQTFDL